MSETFLSDGTVLRIKNFRRVHPDKNCNSCKYFIVREYETDRRMEVSVGCSARHHIAGETFNTDFEGSFIHVCDTWEAK